jgi:hypothetical protein
MNIALSAVIISILLIPPVVFYISLYIGRFPKAVPKFSLFEGILASAVISLFIHAIAIYFIGNDIRFDIIIKMLGGDLKNLEGTVPNPEFKKAVSDFTVYNFLLVLTMVILARVIRYLLQVTELHARFELLNLYNKWWYYFNGYYADVDEFDLVFVDAVVDTKDGAIIYSGFLVYFETKDGELDRIYLKDALRREFKRQTAAGTLINESGTPVQIPGATFSLKYENVINLNVNFILIDEGQVIVTQPAQL